MRNYHTNKDLSQIIYELVTFTIKWVFIPGMIKITFPSRSSFHACLVTSPPNYKSIELISYTNYNSGQYIPPR